MYRLLAMICFSIVTLAMARPACAEKIYYLHDPGGNTAAHIYTYTRVNAEYDRVVIDGRCVGFLDSEGGGTMVVMRGDIAVLLVLPVVLFFFFFLS